MCVCTCARLVSQPSKHPELVYKSYGVMQWWAIIRMYALELHV